MFVHLPPPRAVSCRSPLPEPVPTSEGTKHGVYWGTQQGLLAPLILLCTGREAEVSKVSDLLGRHWAGAAATHQPHHEVGEHCDPQSGRDEGDHEELLPAGFAAVGDGDAQEEDEGPSEHPLSLVAFCLCTGVWGRNKDIGLHGC